MGFEVWARNNIENVTRTPNMVRLMLENPYLATWFASVLWVRWGPEKAGSSDSTRRHRGWKKGSGVDP